MTSHASRGVLYVHSAPSAVCPHIEWAASRALDSGVTFTWEQQPVLRGSHRAEFFWTGPSGTGARLASALRGWEHVRYEVTEDAGLGCDGGRWMSTPTLGIYYAPTDTAGNILVPEERLRRAIQRAGTDLSELHRELQVLLGKEWDDELEPFRHAHDDTSVIWLHKVG